MANEIIGENGGKYCTLLKNSKGDRSPWLNLGGRLKTSNVEVELAGKTFRHQYFAVKLQEGIVL